MKSWSLDSLESRFSALQFFTPKKVDSKTQENLVILINMLRDIFSNLIFGFNFLRKEVGDLARDLFIRGKVKL